MPLINRIRVNNVRYNFGTQMYDDFMLRPFGRNMLYDLAKLCSDDVVVIESNCCGFAGDRGFTYPELNTHGLRHLREQIDGRADGSGKPCVAGYATSRTCEIGLSRNSGVTFRSILYLLDEVSERK